MQISKVNAFLYMRIYIPTNMYLFLILEITLLPTNIYPHEFEQFHTARQYTAVRIEIA
jgi:hypothetical protein